MKALYFLFFVIFISGCEEEFSFQVTEDLLYDVEWKMWEKTIQSLDTNTGKITKSVSRDLNYRIIFANDTIRRSTNVDLKLRAFPTVHLSLDSISFMDIQFGVKTSYLVREFFGRKKTIYNDQDSSMLPFYTYLKLENKEKFYGEDQELTEFLLLYRE